MKYTASNTRDSFKVRTNSGAALANGSVVHGVTAGFEQQEVIEVIEQLSGWLMDGAYDAPTQRRDGLQRLHHLTMNHGGIESHIIIIISVKLSAHCSSELCYS